MCALKNIFVQILIYILILKLFKFKFFYVHLFILRLFWPPSSVIKSVSWQILPLCHHKARTWNPYTFMSLCSVHIRSCDRWKPRQHSYWQHRSLQKWDWLLSSWERVHLPRLPLWSAAPTIHKLHLEQDKRRVQTSRLFRPHRRSYSWDRSRFVLRITCSLLICGTFFKFICKPHNDHKFSLPWFWNKYVFKVICISVYVILNICLIR